MHSVTLPKVDPRRRATQRQVRTVDTAADISRPGGRVCSVCARHEARYCCPRCFASYCTKDCYQTHSTACTEEFSKSHIQKELGVTSETSLQEKAHMLKHWRAVAEAADNPQLLEPEAGDADEDEDGATSLQSLLAAMREGQPIDLSMLSDAQLRQLHQQASSLVRLRTPWWDTSSGGAGVHVGEVSDGEIEPEEEDEEEHKGGEDEGGVHVVAVSLRSDLPRFHAQMRQILEVYVPDLASLTSAGPSDQMVWHLVALLFGYVIMMRYTNMGWLDDPADALEALVMSSPAFQTEFRAASAVDVVEACIKHVCDYVTAGSNRMPLLNDVRAILADEMMLAYAILDAWALATTAADRPDKETMQALKLSCTGRMPQPAAVGPLLRDFATQFRSRLKGRPSPAQLAQRKLYYMLCFVKKLVLGESQLLEDSIAEFTRYLTELAVVHQESR